MGSSSSILLLALIEDILDLSKMEAGTFSLTNTQFMIPELLNNVCELFQFQCEQKKLELVVEVDPWLKKLQLISDLGRIRQILLNLITNALKFTFEGRIEVKAKLVTLNGKTYSQFCISDTGIGIPRLEQKNLFKLFGMLDFNKEINKNGWGIGLTVSKKFTEALGGQIWMESEYQKGSAVYFTIPYPSPNKMIDDSLELLLVSEEISGEIEFARQSSRSSIAGPMNDFSRKISSRNKINSLTQRKSLS
jgi:two-component system, sensor histidine kinase and response regulator